MEDKVAASWTAAQEEVPLRLMEAQEEVASVIEDIKKRRINGRARSASGARAIHARASSGEPLVLRVAAAAEADPAFYVATAHPRAALGARPIPIRHAPRPSVEPVPALRRAGLPAASLVAQTLSLGSIIRSAVDWLTLQRGWRRR